MIKFEDERRIRTKKKNNENNFTSTFTQIKMNVSLFLNHYKSKTKQKKENPFIQLYLICFIL